MWLVSGIPFFEFGLDRPLEGVVAGVSHALAYLVLFLLLARAFDAGQRIYSPALLLRAATLTTLYALVDEVHQSFVPGREGSGMDIIIDGAGIFVGTLYFRLRYKW